MGASRRHAHHPLSAVAVVGAADRRPTGTSTPTWSPFSAPARWFGAGAAGGNVVA